MSEHRGQDARFDRPPPRATGKAPCRSLTSQGEPCENQATRPDVYCHHHRDNPRPYVPDDGRAPADAFPALAEAEREHGADPYYVARLFGRAPLGAGPVELPDGRRLRWPADRDGYVYEPNPLALHLLRQRAEEYGGLKPLQESVGQPDATTRAAITAGQSVVRAIRREHGSVGAFYRESPPRMALASSVVRAFVRHAGDVTLLAHLQAGEPLPFDEELTGFVALDYVDAPAPERVQRRSLSAPPRLWAYFKVAVLATYLHLEDRMPHGGPEKSWGVPKLATGRRGPDEPGYKALALELTARLAKELEPVWLGDLEADHVRAILKWSEA